MSVLLDVLPDWLTQLEFIQPLLRLPWERLQKLFIGEKIALGTLLGASLLGSVAAVNRFLACEFAFPKPRKSVRTPRRKKGFGIKHAVLLLVAILPGGLVGSFAVYAVMGRAMWRRDALIIVGASFVPALLLLLLRASFFPWPHFADEVYISGILGITFGLLHVWAMIKLLREWWGEPEECVAWWPPAALWVQLAFFAACAMRILEP
jgi:hypothetical protein